MKTRSLQLCVSWNDGERAKENHDFHSFVRRLKQTNVLPTHLLAFIDRTRRRRRRRGRRRPDTVEQVCFFDPKNRNRVFQIIITSHMEEGLEERRKGGGNRVVFIPSRVSSVLKVNPLFRFDISTVIHIRILVC